MNERIYLSPPFVDEVEKNYMLDAFDSNWIAPVGPDIDNFENEIASFLAIEGACALSSGTAALHLALKILGVKKGDRVLCPSLTFVATANAILYQNAEPVFIDSSLDTWVLDINVLEKAIKKYKPKALISVDLYGQSCDYDQIYKLCNENNVFVIEDAAEALGSEYKDKKCGSFGEIGILSFNGNKIITSSGGGTLVSHNEEYVRKAKFLSTQAREPFLHYEHRELGYNYRLSNISAAIGRAQLKKIEKFIEARRYNFEKYYEILSKVDGFSFMPKANNVNPNRWLTTFTVDSKKCGFSNTDIINLLESENIESRPVWKPMHMQPLFIDYKYVTHNGKDAAASLFNQGICLPSGACLKDSNRERIIDLILSLTK